MSFYSSALYEREVEYSEMPPSAENPRLNDQREVEWRPSAWLSRAAATLTMCAVFTSPVSTSRPIVILRSTTVVDDRAAPSPDYVRAVTSQGMTASMRQRASIAMAAFDRVPLSAAERADDPEHGF